MEHERFVEDEAKESLITKVHFLVHPGFLSDHRTDSDDTKPEDIPTEDKIYLIFIYI